MLQLIKDAIKCLPYPQMIRLYYLYYLAAYLPAYEFTRVRARLPRLAQVDLEKFKASDTLFILGSGASINRISRERWEAIARCDTIGFNFWLYHWFVPRMYFFESAGAGDAFRHEMMRRFLQISARRGGDYRDTVKVVMDLVQPGRQYVYDLPEAWRENLYAAYLVPAVAKTDQQLATTVALLKRHGVFAPRSRMNFIFKHGATLVALVTLGARMGYKRIVLCGIDLTRAEYFYQDPQLYPETKDLSFIQRSATHATLRGNTWIRPVDATLLELQRQVLEPAGIDLYVEHSGSALYPRIPLAPPELFEVSSGLPASATG